jgi:hypothetical protein
MTALSAEKAALKIYATMDRYRSGEISKLAALNELDVLVSSYFEVEVPISYTLTEKVANG